MKSKYLRFIFVFIVSLVLCNVTESIYAVQNKVAQSTITNKNRIRNARLFVEANLAKNTGKYKQAEKLYLECLKYDPNDAASMYELGSLYLSSQRVEEAKKYALKASIIDPENNYYKILLADVYQIEGDFSGSIELLKNLANKYPGKSNYLRQLAYMYVLAQSYDEAIQVLDQLEGKTGISEIISLQKQQLHLNLNKPDKAIYEIERLINEYPFETRYYALLAELCVQYNRDEKAIWAYEQIAAIDPKDAYVHISLFDFYRKRNNDEKAFNELKLGFANPDLDVETKFQVLLSYYTADQIYTTKNEQARELVWIVEKTHPDHPRAMALKADLLYRNKEFEEARTLLKKVIEIDKDQYPWFEMLLIVESELRNFKAMATEGEKTIQMFPDQPLPYLISGLGNIQLKDFKKAEKYFIDGLNYSKGNSGLMAQFYSYLGDTYHELEEIEKSDEAYENALKYDTANSVVLNNYSYYLALRGVKLERADLMSKKAVELDPENSSNIDTRAWVLYKLQRYEEALVWIEKAYDIDGDQNAELMEHYGDILYKLGEKKRALKFWKKARELGDGSNFLERKIKDKKLYE